LAPRILGPPPPKKILNGLKIIGGIPPRYGPNFPKKGENSPRSFSQWPNITREVPTLGAIAQITEVALEKRNSFGEFNPLKWN